MKLSQLSTKEALSKILMLIPVIKEIINDKKLLATWKKGYKIEPNATAVEIEMAKQECANERILNSITLLLEEHTPAVYKILSIMNDKTPNEIAEQPIIDTIQQLQELLTDEGLIQLFTTQKTSAVKNSSFL